MVDARELPLLTPPSFIPTGENIVFDSETLLRTLDYTFVSARCPTAFLISELWSNGSHDVVEFLSSNSFFALKYIHASYYLLYLLSQADIIPWLGSKPDVKKIGEVRRVIKSLRSRLRHRLADKKDLEEVGRKCSGRELS